MVVKNKPVDFSALDLAYLGQFLGMRVNQLVKEDLQSAGFVNIRESHGYVIQHLIESERSITELAARMEVTQQAASKVVAELSKLGIVEILPAADRRAKIVRLSDRGVEAVQFGRQARKRIERRLIQALGSEPYKLAKTTLSLGLETLGGIERIRARRIQPPE